jgi:hypothetical protein
MTIGNSLGKSRDPIQQLNLNPELLTLLVGPEYLIAMRARDRQRGQNHRQRHGQEQTAKRSLWVACLGHDERVRTAY